jgi:hypothetical protein
MTKETLEEAAERFYPISKGGSMWMPSADDCNKANKQEGFIEGYNHSQYSHPHSDDDMIEFASFCFDAVGDISGKYINKTNQELLEIWKEERIKTIYYE